MTVYYLVRIIGWFVCLLPHNFRLHLGNLFGIVAWRTNARWRRLMAIDNAVKSLNITEEEAAKIVEASVRRFGNMLVDILIFPNLNKNNIRELVTFEGEEHIRNATDAGRGFIIATAHFGNWEMLGTALALYGYPLVSVGKKLKKAYGDRLIIEYRAMSGAYTTYKTSVFEMVRLMGNGCGIGLLMDQNAKTDGVAVDFLNQQSSVPKGPVVLARLKDAPVLPILIYDNPDGTYLVKIHPPVELVKTKDKAADIKENTQRTVRVIEQAIKEKPEMWLWLYNRWEAQREYYKSK